MPSYEVTLKRYATFVVHCANDKDHAMEIADDECFIGSEWEPDNDLSSRAAVELKTPEEIERAERYAADTFSE